MTNELARNLLTLIGGAMPAYVDIGSAPGQIRFTATASGADGNGITVQYVDDPGALRVDVTDTDILITLTDGGISGLEIIAAVGESAAASELVVASLTPENPYAPATNDGSGLSSAADAATPQVLAGGVPRLPVFEVGPRGAVNVLSLNPVTGAPVVTVYNANGDLVMYLRDDGATWFAGGRVQVSPGGAFQVNIDGTAGEPDGSELFALQVDGSPLFVVQPGSGWHTYVLNHVDTDVALELFPSAGQAVDMLRIGLTRINKDQVFMTQAHEPADADIQIEECAFWFDSTNSAAKLMVKGKSADGTVVVGEVALA